MSCTAAFNQKAFRGRNDDGTQATATWKAAQNTAWTQAVDENFRVRLEVQETAGCAKNNFSTIRLQYNLNSAGWVNVTATSNVVRSSASPNEANAATLTDQLTVGTGTFVGAGCFEEVDGLAGTASTDVAASGHFEVEYCCQVLSADVANNDTIQLRVTDGGTAFAAYDATASLTVSESAVSTRGRVSFVELETPFVTTRGRVSFAELEAPFVNTRGRVSFVELEVPIAPTRGRISFTELEVPGGANPTRGQVSFAELEVPIVNTRGRISFVELEVPLAPTRGRVSFAEFETPLAPTRGLVSWVALEVPAAPTRGRISFAELEVPEFGVVVTPYHPGSRSYRRYWYRVYSPGEPY